MPCYGSFGLSNAPRAGCANRRFAWRWLAQSATLLTTLTLAVSPSMAASTRVAVAANFTEAAQEIAAAFTAATGDTAELSFGSTGTLYTQISQGAPYEVFLAADAERPEKAIAEGLAVAGSRFTYATGRLVLYSTEPSRVTGETTLTEGAFERLAIANPATAPYGAAAVATLQALGIYEAVRPKLVQGTSIAQAYQFVATGNAELGLVALAQVAGKPGGSHWQVPAELHPAIDQDAVLLEAGRDSAAARAFLDFLKSPETAAIIRRYGYETGA
ncbi:MAG: molybdate ABC transporter substrate-binding protein [Aurantimonas sp.]|nr:molybdate ABC transporter substrate-binding protein [Aurantimonas sp.]